MRAEVTQAAARRGGRSRKIPNPPMRGPSAAPTTVHLPAPTDTMPLTDAEHALLERAATLSREIVSPNAARWERERRIGHEGLAAAVEIGLTRLQVPLAFGGLAMSFSCKAQLADVLGAGDFGFTMSLINTQNIAAKLARDARPEVAARYVPDLIAGRRLGCTALTEPGAGSDFAAITTLATRVDGGWRIDGAKAWISNAGEADVVYQAAFADERFVGFADFLVRDTEGRWQVWDTKLARAASVPALLQLAAYAEQLPAMGAPVADQAILALGSGEREGYPLSVITPVYAERRARVLTLLDAHQDTEAPAVWGTGSRTWGN